jgi:hypothetical protein
MDKIAGIIEVIVLPARILVQVRDVDHDSVSYHMSVVVSRFPDLSRPAPLMWIRRSRPVGFCPFRGPILGLHHRGSGTSGR